MELLVDEAVDPEIRLEACIVVGSVARGSGEIVLSLIEAGFLPAMVHGLYQSDLSYVEACLRCLKNIFMSDVSPTDYLYKDPSIFPHLLNIMPQTMCTQECVAVILSNICKTPFQQKVLFDNKVIEHVAHYVFMGNFTKVVMAVLRFFGAFCYRNLEISQAVATAEFTEGSLLTMLAERQWLNKPCEMQLAAAKCLTNMFRAGALSSDDKIVDSTLATLVRMTKDDRKWEERAQGAETLAYLIDTDLRLQQIAAISDQLINTLADYFHYPGRPVEAELMPTKQERDITLGNDLRHAAFNVYAALASNDEAIRKKIINTENIMKHIVNGLSDPVTKVQIAALRCLHSMSRSIQILRTHFQDHEVYKPLLTLLTEQVPMEAVKFALATICNLVLVFSASKKDLLEAGILEILVNYTTGYCEEIQVNALWALMNLIHREDQALKQKMMNLLSMERLRDFVDNGNAELKLKALGLVRNILTERQHIDFFMEQYGTQIIELTLSVIEKKHSPFISSHAFCILANIADGPASKSFIMNNDHVLHTIVQNSTGPEELSAAAACLVTLANSEDHGVMERRNKLKAKQVYTILGSININNPVLREKMNSAIEKLKPT